MPECCLLLLNGKEKHHDVQHPFFVLYAVGTSMCGGLLVLLCLPLCALLRRLRAPSKLLCLLWLAVGLRFLLPGGIPVSIRQLAIAACAAW